MNKIFKNNSLTYGLIASLAVLGTTTANASSVAIENAGFESSFTGWDDTDPSALSADANTGSRSAKITGVGGKVEQIISVEPNTNYTLSAYVRGSGEVGAYVGNTTYSQTGGGNDFELVSVAFNSGDAATITIFGAYSNDEGRFDDFTLVTDGVSEPTPTPETQPTPGQIIATASADDGNVADNVLDDDLSTRWSANGDGQWLSLDLGSEQEVVGVEIAFYKGNERSSDFEIQVSTDGTYWDTAVYLTPSSGVTAGFETFTFDTSVSARYVRYVGYGNTANTWNSLTEFTVVNCSASECTTPVEPDPEPTPSSITASASSNDGNVPANTLDNNLDTRWSADGNGQWLALDLGEVQQVGTVNIAFFKGNERVSYFDIETSADGTSWTTVLDNAVSAGNTLELESFAVVETNAQYVRYVGQGNSSNTWNSLTEISVSTEGGLEQPVTPEIPTDPELPVGNAQYPSDLMRNYDQWKITYPDGGEVKQLFQETNEYFYVNEAQNGIVFYAPVRSSNGTTPNSSYIRSELRERTADGSSDIYWTTTGKHVVYAKQAITHLPIVKPHLVATQIHGDKSEGIDDSLVLRLEEEHLFLSFNGGQLRSDVTVKTDYVLGTVHEVIFEVINDKHYVYYSEDGNLASAYAAGNASQYLVKDGSQDYLMDLNYGQSYFKIGNYTQSNADREGSYTDDPENYGEVVVYDFWVDHQ